MKTLLIITEETQGKHAGEQVDDFIIVEPFIDPNEISVIANLVRNKIREMVIEEKKESGEDVREIKIELDASPIYDVVMVGLSDTMGKEEGLAILLPDRLSRDNDEEEKVIIRED